MRGSPILLAFNRGIMSPRALARVDLKKTVLAAEECTNWLPRALGSMSLRPGTEYLGSTAGDGVAVFLPFVFSTDDSALVELTDGAARVWVGDEVLAAPAVGTTLANGDFATDLTGWTDADEAGATSEWSAGAMALTGTGVKKAIRHQVLTIATGDQNVAHSLLISTSRIAGSCEIRIGTALGGTQLAGPITLRPGSHVVTFTPTGGTVYVRLSNQEDHTALVNDITLAAAAPIEIPTVWAEANLPNVRWEQSGDVIFLCDGSHRQQRIERWGSRSWSVVDYRASDGPFRPTNTSPITLTSAAYAAPPHAASLTASADLFTAGHVGSLFRLERTGQTASEDITAADQWTGSIRVTNVGGARIFSIVITGFHATLSDTTITLQRSLGGEGDWFDVASYTKNTTAAFDDGLDNNIAYYRIGVKTGDFSTHVGTVTLSYAAGVSTDVIRVTAYSSATVVYGVLESSLGGFGSTSTWWEGRWADARGWPSAVALHEGRLWWAGSDRIDGSVSDSYAAYGDETEGDSGPISRNIAVGPVDTVNWLVGLDRLLVGTEGSELQAKSSSLDEALTPSAFSLKTVSTQGSTRAPAAKIDTGLVFVHRNGTKLYEIALADSGYNYLSGDLMVVAPDIGKPGIVRVAVSRQPDTRVWCVLSDGSMAVLVFDKAEEVKAWVKFTTDGYFEDVAALPGGSDDSVYVVVRRTVDGDTKRYLEKFLPEAEPGQAADSRLADCHVHVDGPLEEVTGLAHLEGAEVVVWAEGRDVGAFTVSSGAVNLPATLTDITIGLPYTARYKSARIGIPTRGGDMFFTAAKQISHVGLVLQDTHARGLRYGQSFDYLDDMPMREGYATVDPDTIHTSFEGQSIEVGGTWESDARLCLEAAAPRPCVLVACTIELTGYAK